MFWFHCLRCNTNRTPVRIQFEYRWPTWVWNLSAALEQQPPPFTKVRVRLPAGSCRGRRNTRQYEISGGLARFLRMWYQPNNLLELSLWWKHILPIGIRRGGLNLSFDSKPTRTPELRNEYKPLISVLTVDRRLREAGSKDLIFESWSLQKGLQERAWSSLFFQVDHRSMISVKPKNCRLPSINEATESVWLLRNRL